MESLQESKSNLIIQSLDSLTKFSENKNVEKY
jgi:hypothetical protein